MAEIITQQWQNPLASFAGGLQFGQGIRQMQQQAEAEAAARAKAEQEAAAEAEKQAQLSAFYDKVASGTVTVQDFQGASRFLTKEQSDSWIAGHKALSDEQRQTGLRETAQLFAALNSGHTEVAFSLMDEQVKALENAGHKEEAQAMSALREAAKADPKAVAAYFGTYLGSMGEDGVRTLDNALKLTRSPEGHTQAEADILLTEAQIKESQQRVEKLGVELKAMEKSGGIPPEKIAEAEDSLRKELATQTKEFRIITDSYFRVEGANKTGAGDLAIVFNFMKMLDPNSSVREGEQASAANAAGVPSAIIAQYNKLRGGGILDQKARDQMLSEAKRISERAAAQSKQAEDKILGIAKRRGLNVANIVPPAGAQAVPPAAEQTADW
jgi:hypothetical protein